LWKSTNDVQAAVTYGDPLKNYAKAMGGWGKLPEERSKVFCNQGDGVCGGAFSISAAHLSYTSNGDIAKGVSFVVDAIQKYRSGSSSAGSAEEAPSTPAASAALPAGKVGKAGKIGAKGGKGMAGKA
jgi:Cutinase